MILIDLARAAIMTWLWRASRFLYYGLESRRPAGGFTARQYQHSRQLRSAAAFQNKGLK